MTSTPSAGTTPDPSPDPSSDPSSDLALDLAGGTPAGLEVAAPIGPGATQAASGSVEVAPAPQAQHGLGAHSHGPGAPAVSRATRHTSFAVEDFPVPTGREEEWRFTPVAPVRQLFHPAPGAASGLQVSATTPEGVSHRRVAAGQRARGRAFVPGDRAAAVAHADADGADVVSIRAEAQVAVPVLVRLHATGDRAAGHLVIEAGPHSRATVVVEHTGSGAVASGVEVVLGDGAALTVVSVQQWDDGAVHLTQHDALVGRDATLKHVAVTLGGAVVRMGATVRYDGPGGDATLLGVYFADAGQHLEHRSFVDHGAPSCRSNVVYKGALQGRTARTVWVGDVLIRPTALGTDTYELNRNLVLTDGARADSVPNLEIQTGEIVGAGHASATGRFDDEQLFYLQSRGLTSEQARRMVVRAFFADVLGRIGVPEVTERLMAAIEVELEGAPDAPPPAGLPPVAGAVAEAVGAAPTAGGAPR